MPNELITIEEASALIIEGLEAGIADLRAQGVAESDIQRGLEAWVSEFQTVNGRFPPEPLDTRPTEEL